MTEECTMLRSTVKMKTTIFIKYLLIKRKQKIEVLS